MARQNTETLESTVMSFLQLNETTDTTVLSNNKLGYVSLIKINGKPILPPLMDEEKRKEMQKYKEKAIEIELKLDKEKKKNATKPSSNSSEISSIANIPPNRQSTPARPVTLNLSSKGIKKNFALTKSGTEESLNKYAPIDCEIVSSHEKNVDKLFKSTLEQRLASDDFLVRNKLNKCQQSPIVEEQVADSELDKRWSPLKIDSISSLRIELPTKDSTDDNLEIYLDESQNTPDTVTHSPSLLRQNSYTLLTPSPALLQYLESRKEEEIGQQSHSGRKTWDLNKAKQDWDPSCEELRKSSDEDCITCDFRKSSVVQNRIQAEYNSLEYDSATSPDSYASKKNVPKVAKIKCKLKGKKIRSTKSVPLPNAIDKVPFTGHSKSMQGLLCDRVPLEVNDELTDLSDLLLRMKLDHERQKKELEQKQKSEMKRLEIIFQRKEAEFLNKINQPRKGIKSIYSQSSQESAAKNLAKTDTLVMGDGNHNRVNEHSASEHCLGSWGQNRRPHSAKDMHPGFSPYEKEWNRRTRSMDFSQANQDTDLDISFQDDFTQSKGTTSNNEYVLESDSVSNFSSKSSTVSSDCRHDPPRPRNFIKFQGISSEEFAKYNQAASKITAAARGYLTRRLLRTAHVQGLITTLKDAITCATQLHTASDIADSDIDLMKRLGRQIEAAWDAVYAVFFNTETSTKLQLIATDRERLKAAITKISNSTSKKKRLSSATKKSLDRKKGTAATSKSQTSNGFTRTRMCTKMAASYLSPLFPQKLK